MRARVRRGGAARASGRVELPERLVQRGDLGLDLGNHPENATLDLPCRTVFAAGQKDIRVWGPVPEVEAEIAALHVTFWQRDAAG